MWKNRQGTDMKENEIVIEGFCFTDARMAEQAKREADGIRYIKENTDMESPEMVLQLYHKLIAERLFETPVGIGFLKEMRDYLAEVPGIREQELEKIAVAPVLGERELRRARREKAEDRTRMEKKLKAVKKNLRTSLVCNLFLIILVIGMVIVAMTSKQPNILNYENSLIDKYAQWQQELEEREQAVREKEQELKITP